MCFNSVIPDMFKSARTGRTARRDVRSFTIKLVGPLTPRNAAALFRHKMTVRGAPNTHPRHPDSAALEHSAEHGT